MNYKRLLIPNSYIFLTVVTYNRQPILIKNIGILRESFKNSKEKYKYDIYAVIINKDHFHIIIKPENINNYPKIIAEIKRYFTKHINKDYVLNKNNEANIWQRRYWEHTIRDEEDLNKHTDYIHYNSMKHYNIAPKDWAYSSFKKFVNNGYYENDWCNYNDKNKIEELSYE